MAKYAIGFAPQAVICTPWLCPLSYAGILAFGSANGKVGVFDVLSGKSYIYGMRHSGPVTNLGWSVTTTTTNSSSRGGGDSSGSGVGGSSGSSRISNSPGSNSAVLYSIGSEGCFLQWPNVLTANGLLEQTSQLPPAAAGGGGRGRGGRGRGRGGRGGGGEGGGAGADTLTGGRLLLGDDKGIGLKPLELTGVLEQVLQQQQQQQQHEDVLVSGGKTESPAALPTAATAIEAVRAEAGGGDGDSDRAAAAAAAGALPILTTAEAETPGPDCNEPLDGNTTAVGASDVSSSLRQQPLIHLYSGSPSHWSSSHWTCFSWYPWGEGAGGNSILALGASQGQLLVLFRRESGSAAATATATSSRGGVAGGVGVLCRGWEVGCRVEGEGPGVVQLAWQPPEMQQHAGTYCVWVTHNALRFCQKLAESPAGVSLSTYCLYSRTW